MLQNFQCCTGTYVYRYRCVLNYCFSVTNLKNLNYLKKNYL